MNLGRLELHSKPRSKQDDNTANVRALYTQGHSEEEILAEMISKSYDNFVLQLSDLQVCLQFIFTQSHLYNDKIEMAVV